MTIDDIILREFSRSLLNDIDSGKFKLGDLYNDEEPVNTADEDEADYDLEDDEVEFYTHVTLFYAMVSKFAPITLARIRQANLAEQMTLDELWSHTLAAVNEIGPRLK